MSNLNGKVALITGAARGQGAAEARLFAQRGAKVMLCDILDSEGQAVAAEIGANAAYLRLDVTSEASWQAAVKAAVSKFGKLNVLVNNAGIVKVTDLADCPLEEYMQVIQVNQVGVFLGMKTVVPAMKQAGGGSIVNISSIDGLIGMTGGTAYCASKFAVRGMTKVAALELGKDGIRVNSIHPGGILTPMDRRVACAIEWRAVGLSLLSIGGADVIDTTQSPPLLDQDIANALAAKIAKKVYDDLPFEFQNASDPGIVVVNIVVTVAGAQVTITGTVAPKLYGYTYAITLAFAATR